MANSPQVVAQPFATAPLAPGKTVPRFALVIFGASGDLARRKLIPAIWNLCRAGQLPPDYVLIGASRSNWTDDQFRAEMKTAVRTAEPRDFDETLWREFAARLSYLPGQYESPADFRRLEDRLKAFEAQRQAAPVRIFYLSTPADAYQALITNLGQLTGELQGGSRARPDIHNRIVIEKPHGRNLAEARRINDLLDKYFARDEVFRIDHYLGKETVQNILVLRFANGIFEPLWNRKNVAYVEITAAETLGVAARGKFYEQTGALRDMVQMHLLQLLTLVAMEQPVSFGVEDVRDEKAKVLRVLRPITADRVFQEAVRGQYGPGAAPDSQAVPGYRQTPDVAAASSVETYVALRTYIDNWRWQGVPFYLRTGKCLDHAGTNIAIHFQGVPTCLFGQREICARIDPNVLVMRVQPQEGVHLRLASEIPGAGLNISSVRLDFDYADVFVAQPAEAYQSLLLDVMLGDTALFARRDQVELAWQYVQPLLDTWSDTPAQDFPNYPAGARGPAAADQFIAQTGHAWHDHRKAARGAE